MAFFRKLLWSYLAPLIAFFALCGSSHGIFTALEQAILPYIADTPLSGYLFGSTVSPEEIPLLISSVTHQSHVEKIGPIAVALAELGHPVTFICGNAFENYISNLHPNVKFYPFQGLDDKLTPEDLAYWMSLPSGVEKEIWISKKVIVDGVNDAHNTYQTYFKEFRDKYGNQKPLISLYDCTVTGHQTVHLGVPGIKPDVSIGISILPLMIHSNETFPPRSGKIPHEGADAKAVHQEAYETIKKDDPYEWEVSQAWWEKLKEMGSTQNSFPQILDGMNRNPDQLLTIGIPEFEFPRTELDIDLRYFGALKMASKSQETDKDLPSWWDDVHKAKQEGKKIVVVTQGTVETIPGELILPTLKALGENENIFVVATFYNSEPEEVEGLVVPSNARVAKYVPHDELLPLVSTQSLFGGYRLTEIYRLM